MPTMKSAEDTKFLKDIRAKIIISNEKVCTSLDRISEQLFTCFPTTPEQELFNIFDTLSY